MRTLPRLRVFGWALVPALFAVALTTAAVPKWVVKSATLQSKTDRYGHNVLGGNEYAELNVQFLSGGDIMKRQTITLPPDRVFEDIEARITDLTLEIEHMGDRPIHIVVVESSARGGAELAVYGLRDGKIEKIAATPPIGRRNRWLAPAGIADFDGDGQNDIAYVETPHIGGTLRIWTMREGKLVQIASKRGFSNHRIGEDFITGGVRDCGQGPELVLPNFNWSGLMVARMTGDGIATREIGSQTGKAAVDAALACQK